MRSALLSAAILVFAVPVPALGQSGDEVPESSAKSDMMGKLSDSAEQEKMAAMLATMSDILLDLPVGPFLDMAARVGGEDVSSADRPVDPNATVRDLAGSDADRIPEVIADKLPVMMTALAGMAENMEAMRPMLENMAKRMEDSAADFGQR